MKSKDPYARKVLSILQGALSGPLRFQITFAAPRENASTRGRISLRYRGPSTAQIIRKRMIYSAQDDSGRVLPSDFGSAVGVQTLQGVDLDFSALQGGNAFGGGVSG